SLMASGAVRWFSPITMSVGSKTNTSGASCNYGSASRWPKGIATGSTQLMYFQWFAGERCNLEELQHPFSAAYNADRESFHAMCRYCMDLRPDHDHHAA